MRKKLLIILICMLIFSSLIIVKSSKITQVESTSNMDYTHNIFAELCSSTDCKFCKFAHAALKNIYAEGTYPFYYISLVSDNIPSLKRIYFDFNVVGLPTVIFDGGYKVVRGASDVSSAQNNYEASIIECGNREAPDIDINLQVKWIDNSTMDIDVSVQNNEAEEYDGHIRVFVTEKSSSLWVDTWGIPYTFAFLDYAFDEDINILSAETWQKSTTWDGEEYGFGFITCENIMVFAVVFNSEWHQGYSIPPDQGPFDAYYVDEVVAESPPVGSTPPTKPAISGPNSGTPGNEYTYEAITTDNDGDQLHYWFEWGDDTNSGWLGPYDSGDTANASHIWSNRGIYKVKVKAKDPYNIGSEWSDILLVTMPRSKISGNNLFLNFLERFLNVFPILQQLLNR